jgi:RimJ/RimL family protein N-acetyltransferase
LSDGVVRLRAPREPDAGWIADAVADPEISRWTRVPSPYTKDDAFAWIALAESMLREDSAYHLLIAGVDDGALLGSVGLEVQGKPALRGEVGYWVAAPARGKGVATRAVRLLVAWAFERLELSAIEIHVMPANLPSHAVALKTGFKAAERRLLPFRTTIEEFDIYVRNADGAVANGRPVA